MGRPNIIRHAGRNNRKLRKAQGIDSAKESNRNQRISAIKAAGESVYDLGVSRDRLALLQKIGFITGTHSYPLHFLMDGIETEEEKQRLFSLRETLFSNAYFLFHSLDRLERGKSDPTEKEMAIAINEVYAEWQKNALALNDYIQHQESRIATKQKDANGHG